MAEEGGGRGSSWRIPVVTAVIGLLGTLGAATLPKMLGDKDARIVESAPAAPASVSAQPTPAAATMSGTFRDAGRAPSGNSVHGIPCTKDEQLVYHTHAHLAVFVNSTEQQLPAGVGIKPPWTMDGATWVSSGMCFYWLHTHERDGIIHVEASQRTRVTLGDFFDIWGLLLNRNQVGPAHGPVTAYLNGQLYDDDPAGIPLNAHNVIQLNIGPNPPPAQAFDLPDWVLETERG